MRKRGICFKLKKKESEKKKKTGIKPTMKHREIIYLEQGID